MRIVHTESSRGWGGQEIRILNEAAGMIGRGHEVLLLCTPRSRIEAEAVRFGVPTEALPIARKNLQGVRAVHGWLKSRHESAGGIRRADVINTHSSTDSWLVALACASFKHAPPIVRTRHISAAVPNDLATRWLYGKASRMIVTTGESLRQALIDDNRLNPNKIVSIPTGIDMTHFRPPTADERRVAREKIGAPAEAFVVGIAATLRSWKGHRFLIEAIGRCTASRPELAMRLVIVGDGPQRAALEQQVKDSALKGHVCFAGDQSDVVPWLHAFDLFALPSYANEGVPQALLQAMGCALPAVTTDAGAIPEIAQHGETAYVVAKEDSGALAEALVLLANDPQLRTRLGENACALVRERHGFHAMLDRMEAVFRTVTAR
jgi:glycosyltransferase involved in cell wall biosynthesis